MTESVTPEWRHFRKENSGIAGNNILSLCIDDSDRVLVGHDADGLSRFDGSTWKTYLPNATVTYVGNAGLDHTWILADGISYRLTGDDLTLGAYLGLNPSSGLSLLTVEKSGSVYVFQSSTLTQFKDGHLRTYSTGSNYFRTRAMMATKDSLWIGIGSGIVRYDPQHPGGVPLPEYPDADYYNSEETTSIYRDNLPTFWAGSRSGLHRLANLVWTEFSHSEVPPYPVLSITGDDQSVWVGGTGGFARWDGSSWKPYPHNKALVNQDIRALAVDKKGNLWIGTHGGGLYEYREGGIAE